MPIPSGIGFARGLGNGWEVRGSANMTGLWVGPDYHGDWAFLGPKAIGGDIALTRSLVAGEHGAISATIEGGGFRMPTPSWYTDELCGGRLSLGLNLGLYPTEWLGLYAPLKLTGMVAQCGNRQLNAVPGLGLSIEGYHLTWRTAFNAPISLYQRAWLHPWDIYRLPPNAYIGTQFAFQW